MLLHCFILVLLAHPAVDDLPAGWIKHDFADAGFFVTMPQPKRQSFDDKGPDDKPVHIQMYRGKVAETTYVVSVSTFSLSYITQPVKVILDNARNGSVARSAGKVVSEKDIVLGQVTGRETVVHVAGAGYVRSRIFVFNQRQYAVMIASPQQAELDNTDARRFLESFKPRLIKKTGMK